MGLESGTYINDLVSSNPAGSDLESQGDDHLRLLKSVLQSTFPAAARAYRFPDTLAVQSSNYTVSESGDMHKLIPVDATAGTTTIGLPSATIDGWWAIVHKTDSSSNAVVIDPSGATTINGASTISLTKQYESVIIRWCNSAGVWVGLITFPFTPYYSGGQDIPFTDIAPSANAKRILGAATATDFSEQTIATVLEWLNASMARGDILVRGASNFDRLAIGSAGAFLKSDGTDPSWSSVLPIPARAYTAYTDAFSNTTVLPNDNTIPQVGEGTAIITATITPVKSSSVIRAEAVVWGTASVSFWVTALYKDGAANAVRACQTATTGSTELRQQTLVYEFSPGSTSLITFQVRVGPGAAGTVYVNQDSVNQKMGGVGASTLVLTELFTA